MDFLVELFHNNYLINSKVRSNAIAREPFIKIVELLNFVFEKTFEKLSKVS